MVAIDNNLPAKTKNKTLVTKTILRSETSRISSNKISKLIYSPLDSWK